MGSANVSQSIEDQINSYKTDYALWQSHELKLKHRYVMVAWLRLACFVSAFAIPFSLTTLWSVVFFSVFTLLFVSFFVFVWYANSLLSKRKYASYRMDILAKELRCAENNWANERDGEELIDTGHDYAHDLDLFGKGSLFQFINRTATEGGYLRLAEKLKSLSYSIADIGAKQEAIKELSGLNEYRQHFYALSAFVQEGNQKNKKVDLNQIPNLNFISKTMKITMVVFLITMGVSVGFVALGLWPSTVIMYLFFAGLIISGAKLRKVNRVHGQVASLGNYLNRYAKLIHYVEQTNFESPYINEVKKKFCYQEKTASDVMDQLASLIKRFDQRLNMLMGVVINGMFLWDLLVCMRLQVWYSKYGTRLSGWLEALHELEALNSLATFSYNHPHYTVPDISESTVLKAEELGHPLIPQAERVNNVFNISEERRICVVTGANMAGKSTFLRAVGVALVLAGNGCAVAARHFTYKPMIFITNMRAVDNLLKHESYFFAELSRLKMIVDRLKDAGELFFILDEILKGTNSLDKTQGSIALINRLLGLNGCGLVATHDLELGQLANSSSGRVFNNCFEVTFHDDGLSFDYRLRDGVTQSHNASFLMIKMGLIPKENMRV